MRGVAAALRRFRASCSDARGIALQTVIIMVVLVVIAGAVAGVIISRAGEETSRLEEVNTTIDASKYGSETLCELADHTWDDKNTPNDSSDDVCVPTTSAAPTPTSPDSAYAAAEDDETACLALNPAGVWAADTSLGASPGDGTCTKPTSG